MNFKDVIRFKIVGRCFEDERILNVFSEKSQVGIVYGKNGSGKSTITESIKNYRDNIESDLKLDFLDITGNKLSVSKQEKEKIYIYDEKFIDDNMRFGEEGLKSIVMFGKQKDVDDEINTLKIQRDSNIKLLESLETNYSTYCNNKNIKSPEYYIEKIEENLKEESKWACIDRDIKGNLQKSKVNIDVINDIMSSKNTDIEKEELKSKFNKEFEKYNSIKSNSQKEIRILYPIYFEKSREENLIEMLSKEIKEPTLSKREKIIIDSIKDGKQNFYENVHKNFCENDNNLCPYCLRTLTEEYKLGLIKSIENVLNVEVEEHKQALLKLKISEYTEDYDWYKNININLYLEFADKIEEYNKSVRKINELIENKISNIYNPIREYEEDIYSLINSINGLIVKLEKNKTEYNAAIDNISKTKNEVLLLNKQVAYYDIKDDYSNYIRQTAEKKECYEKINKARQCVDDIEEKIKELNAQKSNYTIAYEKINKYLTYILFTNDKLKIYAKDGKYYVSSNSKDIELQRLSVGERNIIALCYFFVSIMENCQEDDDYNSDCFIILDDPISSFDFQNKVGIYTLLRYVFSKILKNINSKILILSHELEAIYNLSKVIEDIFPFSKNKSKLMLNEIKAKNMLEFKPRNEYSKMLEEIYKFANCEEKYEELEFSIGNTMRKLIEAYGTFNYKCGIIEITSNKDILSKIENDEKRNHFENVMYRLILNGESHTEERAMSVPEEDFFNRISIDEKIKTAKDILVYLYSIDEYHVLRHLDDEKAYIIKGWSEDLDDICDTK